MNRRILIAGSSGLDVGGKAVEVPSLRPLVLHFAASVAKYVHAVMVQADLLAPLILEFVDAALGNPGPDAKHVRVVVDVQRIFARPHHPRIQSSISQAMLASNPARHTSNRGVVHPRG